MLGHMEETKPKNLVHPLDDDLVVNQTTHEDSLPYKKVAVIFFITIIVGVLSGFVGNYIRGALSTGKTTETQNSEKNTVKEAVGIPDKKTFKDSAEGKLIEGGSEGEGSFHLERPGGDSQNVYLTSSTVDLSQYVGTQVRVHGETFESAHVGWLMDVGYVEVLE